MDGLERDLRKDGLVTIKRPDVWTENRLHTYRSEFEAAFKPADDPPFKGFEPNINATASQAQVEQFGLLVDVALKLSAGSSGPKLSQYLATAPAYTDRGNHGVHKVANRTARAWFLKIFDR